MILSIIARELLVSESDRNTLEWCVAGLFVLGAVPLSVHQGALGCSRLLPASARVHCSSQFRAGLPNNSPQTPHWVHREEHWHSCCMLDIACALPVQRYAVTSIVCCDVCVVCAVCYDAFGYYLVGVLCVW